MSKGVQPILLDGGNISIQTAAIGTNFALFAAQPCHQLTVVNDTATDVEVQQGATGVAIPVPDGTNYTFYGIQNAGQLGVRRKDTSNSQVTVKARWEA